MRLVADDVYLLAGFPPYVDAVNVYLAGDVLVDAGYPWSWRRILRQLKGRAVTAHALTHAHTDHVGASAKVKEELGVPLWCGAEDVQAAETGHVPRGPHQTGPVTKIIRDTPPVKVDRILNEGDEVAGFTVLDVPGHSPGHVAYWRESDRTLIAGDVLFNLNPLTGIPGLREPPAALTYDPPLNRESIRRIAELEPATVLLGHGHPLHDTHKLVELAKELPS
jgi:glyoxylase-like metal-dependent hydrolase (beta-lactamase superfamily II)